MIGAGMEAETRAPADETLVSLGQRSFRGMLWMSTGVVGQVVVQVVVLSVLARQVSPSAFGVATAALVVLALSVTIADVGVGPAIVQRRDLERDHVRVAITVSALLGLMIWGVLVAAAPAIAGLFAIPALTPVLRVMGATFFLRSLTVGDHLLQRDLDFRRLTAVELIALIAGYGATSVVLALAGAGVWAIVWGHVAWAGLRTVLLWVVRPHPWRPSLARRPLAQLVRFGAALTVAQVAWVVAIQGDNFVVGRWLGTNALGLYGRAYQLMALPAILFGQVANKVLFPAMASVQDERIRLRHAYRTSVAAIAALTMPVSAMLAVLGSEVILVVLGSEWLPLLGAFDVFVFCMFFRTSSKISDCLALATGAVYPRAVRQWVYAVLVVLGSLVGLRWGLFGVAIGVGIALLVYFLLMARLSLTLVDMSWRGFLGAHGAAVSLSLLVVAVVWPAATALRATGAPSILVLAGTLGTIGLVMFVVLRAAPRIPGLRGTVELLQDLRRLLGSDASRAFLDRLIGRRPEMVERESGR